MKWIIYSAVMVNRVTRQDVRQIRRAPVADGDRVELLRPLQADPKDARRLRAERQRQR